MKSKGMIIAALIVAVLLMIFLQKAFTSIQKANVDLYAIDKQASDLLETTADRLIESYDIAYVDQTSFADLKLNVLLIDHGHQSAVLIEDREKKTVEYERIPMSVSYCNTYIVDVDGTDTMIINTDALLGDPYVRTIAHGYHYRFAKMNSLNPESINYFMTSDQDPEKSFLRYMMIETAKSSYLEESPMDLLHYYYDEWGTLINDDAQNNVVNYDYYDGLLSYVTLKVCLYENPEMDIEAYLDSYKNDQSIYSKDQEFEVMGLLYCLLAEREGIPVILNKRKNVNLYTVLLNRSVIGDGVADESAEKEKYMTHFDAYIKSINKIVKDHAKLAEEGLLMPITITAEIYQNSIHYEDQTYIYTDYKARLDNGQKIEKAYQVVRITPIKVYFME